MRKFAIVALLALAGCDGKEEMMSNTEIIAAVKQCNEAGLRAQDLHRDGIGPIVAVQCYPNK